MISAVFTGMVHSCPYSPFVRAFEVMRERRELMATLADHVTAVALTVFDDSTGFRTKFYWASAISIGVTRPVNFLINKFWIFRGPKVVVVEGKEPVAREALAS